MSGTVLASEARRILIQASNELSGTIRERDDPNADYGFAARALLGLVPGIVSRADRRQEAANTLGKELYSFTKTRYVPQYEPSYELELIDRLALRATEQELDQLLRNDTSASANSWLVPTGRPNRSPRRHPLRFSSRNHELAARAWQVSGNLANALSLLLTGDLAESATDSMKSRAVCWIAAVSVRLSEITFSTIPRHLSSDIVRSNPPASLFPSESDLQTDFSQDCRHALWYVKHYLPGVPPIYVDSLSRLVDGTTPVPDAILGPLITKWRLWLELCQCKDGAEVSRCAPHRCIYLLTFYRQQVEDAWPKLSEGANSLEAYYYGARNALWELGIRVDDNE
jgi:hypothetical protein